VYLLTYSVVNRTSLEYLTRFMDMIPKCLGHRPIMIIVGTMIDRKDRQVTSRQGMAFARTHGCSYFEVSSFVDYSCTVPQVVEEAIRVRRHDKTTPSRLDLDDSMSITSDQSSYYGYKKRTSIDSDSSQWASPMGPSSTGLQPSLTTRHHRLLHALPTHVTTRWLAEQPNSDQHSPVT
jgi:hypothetical protein